MKKFKIMFFLCLILLISGFIYFNTSSNNVNALSFDSSNKELKEIKIDSIIKNTGIDNEEVLRSNIVDNNINFDSINLNNSNKESTITLKLSNPNSDKKANTKVECYSNSNNIKIFTDKSNYIIDENSSINVTITLMLNNMIYSDEEVNYSCSVSTNYL